MLPASALTSRASCRVNGRSAGVLVTHSCVEGTVSPALASEHTLFSGAVSCDRVQIEQPFFDLGKHTCTQDLEHNFGVEIADYRLL